jgi:hypothetical protein
VILIIDLPFCACDSVQRVEWGWIGRWVSEVDDDGLNLSYRLMSQSRALKERFLFGIRHDDRGC